jgi:hypothetical protein
MDFKKIIESKRELVNVELPENQLVDLNDALMKKFHRGEHMCDISEYCVAVLRSLKNTGILKIK